ncbi:MAG: ATP synthase subunit I [Ilumatobacteraceae bacterium]
MGVPLQSTADKRAMAKANAMNSPVVGPSPEVSISTDIIRRGLIVSPLLIAVCGFIWGLHGAWSSAFAVAIVLVNFALAALLISISARISLGMMMGAILFGYLLRLGLIFVAVILVKDAGWISLPALGATIIVTHLGLLLWEMKYLAITLADPGLKARPLVTQEKR